MLSDDVKVETVAVELETVPLKAPDGNILDRPQSIVWRMVQGTHFLLGSLCFIAGSCFYFADVINRYPSALTVGAWFFIVGSSFFLLSDIQDWWYYRIGCLFDWKYREEYEAYNADLFSHPRYKILGRLKRAEVGLNLLASVIGSTLYLVGSILFLPALSNGLLAGEMCFIAGSAVTYLSQGWKIYRIACTSNVDRYDTRFRLNNLFHDIPAFALDTSSGLGAFFYFIGTIFFLPQFTKTDFGLDRAAGLFVCGGVCFTIAGLILQYRHYCTRHK
ncbi:unnamed protein product [Didymodactylos carnosus]|uniref:YrhK domain-containing protein n=1 Tax=Didymodactylos carnosus TaxID=1234261 RepID=A0A8S2F4K2_9BILA|nr:unnamed protein product [Didymodactylos carnosus]CAF4200553.1 unnamed protein product [Didymodactylos carnosus]